MRIDMQETQPLPIFPRPRYTEESIHERFRRLKAFSDRTGVRLLFVYLSDEKQRLKALSNNPLRTRTLAYR